MPVDLFEQKITKKDQLKSWMREKRIFATHEVLRWGTENYYNRAAQTKSDLLHENFIRVLDANEKKARGYTCKDEVYACQEY